MVSVASEVAAAKGWLPGYFEFYFKGKAMAEAAAVETYRADAGDGDIRLADRGFELLAAASCQVVRDPLDRLRPRPAARRLAALRDRRHVAAALDELLADALADVAIAPEHGYAQRRGLHERQG